MLDQAALPLPLRLLPRWVLACCSPPSQTRPIASPTCPTGVLAELSCPPVGPLTALSAERLHEKQGPPKPYLALSTIL